MKKNNKPNSQLPQSKTEMVSGDPDLHKRPKQQLKSGGKAILSEEEVATVTPYFVKTKDVCTLLGGIHARTLRRMVDKGFIRPVRLLRHNLYLLEDVHVLAMNLKEWDA